MLLDRPTAAERCRLLFIVRILCLRSLTVRMGMRKTVRPQLPAASAGILLLLLLVCAATSVDGAFYYVQGQLTGSNRTSRLRIEATKVPNVSI